MTTKTGKIKGIIRGYVGGLTDEDNAKKNKTSASTVNRIKKGAREGDPRVMGAMGDMPEIDQLRECNKTLKATGTSPEELIQYGKIYGKLVEEDLDPIKLKEVANFWSKEVVDLYREYKTVEEKKGSLEKEKSKLKTEVDKREQELKSGLALKYREKWETARSRLDEYERKRKGRIRDLDDEIGKKEKELSQLEEKVGKLAPYVQSLEKLNSYGIENVGWSVDFYNLTRSRLVDEGAEEEDVPKLIPDLVGRYTTLVDAVRELEEAASRKKGIEEEVEKHKKKIVDLKEKEGELTTLLDLLKETIGAELDNFEREKSAKLEEIRTEEGRVDAIRAERKRVGREVKAQHSNIKLAEGVLQYLMDSQFDAKEIVDALAITGRLITPKAEKELLRVLSDPRVRKRAVEIFGKAAGDQFVGIGEHSSAIFFRDRGIEQLTEYKRKYNLFCKFLYNPDSLTEGERKELQKIVEGIGGQRKTVEDLLNIAGWVGLKALDWLWPDKKGA